MMMSVQASFSLPATPPSPSPYRSSATPRPLIAGPGSGSNEALPLPPAILFPTTSRSAAAVSLPEPMPRNPPCSVRRCSLPGSPRPTTENRSSLAVSIPTEICDCQFPEVALRATEPVLNGSNSTAGLQCRQGSAEQTLAIDNASNTVALPVPSQGAHYIPQALNYPTPGGTKRPAYFDSSVCATLSPCNTCRIPTAVLVDRTKPADMNEATSIDLTDRVGVRLTDRQRHLAQLLRATKHKTSVLPIFYFLMAAVGKLMAGFGASMAIKGGFGSTNSHSTLVTGIIILVVGLTGVVIAALGFGAAVSQVDRKMGIALKAASISAACLIAAGYAMNQYFVSTHRPLTDIRLSFLPLCAGTGVMTISITNFTAYTELVRGRQRWIPNRLRPFVAMCCVAPGIGILFGGWISGEQAKWPPAFNAAMLTFAVAVVFAGASILWSNHLRREAEWADCCLLLEEEHESKIRALKAANTLLEAASITSSVCEAEQVDNGWRAAKRLREQKKEVDQEKEPGEAEAREVEHMV